MKRKVTCTFGGIHEPKSVREGWCDYNNAGELVREPAGSETTRFYNTRGGSQLVPVTLPELNDWEGRTSERLTP